MRQGEDLHRMTAAKLIQVISDGQMVEDLPHSAVLTTMMILRKKKTQVLFLQKA